MESRWTILSEAEPTTDGNGWKRRQVMCRCKCGTTRIVNRSDVVTGHSKSCGCLQREKAAQSGKRKATHGLTGSRTYESWSRMKQRCNNQKDPSYCEYGGSGIVVCDEWNNSFESFLRDMGERPNGCSIDRYPNLNGNYEPGNCRWATPKEQGRNRRDNALLEHDGRTMTIVEWSEVTGIKACTISRRLHSCWTVAEALTTPAGQKRKPKP